MRWQENEELEKFLGRGRGLEVLRIKTGCGREGIASRRVRELPEFQSCVRYLLWGSGLHAGDELMNKAECPPPKDRKTIRMNK